MPTEHPPVKERPALVRFLTTEEGGRFTSPASGVRSQLDLGEFQTTCTVESIAGPTILPLGEEVAVTIRPLFADRLGDAFARLESVGLFEGNKHVASGRFIDVADTTRHDP